MSARAARTACSARRVTRPTGISLAYVVSLPQLLWGVCQSLSGEFARLVGPRERAPSYEPMVAVGSVISHGLVTHGHGVAVAVVCGSDGQAARRRGQAVTSVVTLNRNRPPWKAQDQTRESWSPTRDCHRAPARWRSRLRGSPESAPGRGARAPPEGPGLPRAWELMPCPGVRLRPSGSYRWPILERFSVEGADPSGLELCRARPADVEAAGD